MDKKTIVSLLAILPHEQIIGSQEKIINTITLDSRTAGNETLFIAQKGETVDGHAFIDTVIEQGARIIVCEIVPGTINDNTTYIQVADSHAAAGIIASWFYDFPTRQLTVAGVTGTNGKTTVATLLWQAFRLSGYKAGLISTVSYWIDDEEIPSTHTTPDALTLQKLFREMLDAGCTHVAMEVSSHAIAQQRIAGTTFKAGIFTNLTQDHLNFHKTMENYRDTKAQFFSSLPISACAITNADDENGIYMTSNTKAKKVSYGIAHQTERYTPHNVKLSIQGTAFVIEGIAINSSLIGSFNLSNSLAVYATLRELGYGKESVAEIFPKLLPPPGRFEILKGKDQRTGIVDYAHTPDGLEKLLTTVQSMKKAGTSVIVVFGCGGNRDTAKRTIMGTIAGTHADYTIITSDNPRNENPESLCNDIAAGITDPSIGYEIIVDRKAAIYKAVALSKPEDTIVVAGKGHEQYQFIGDQKIPFSDQQVLAEAFATL